MNASFGKLSPTLEWHFLDGAAKVIEKAIGESINERDILRLALDGRIRLGIFCPKKIFARRANFVDLSEKQTTPAKYLKMMIDREFEKCRSMHPLDLIGVPVESFVRTMALADGRIIAIGDDMESLDEGIYDLAMIGDEVADIRHLLRQKSELRVPSEGEVGHRFISVADGQTYQLLEFRSLPVPAVDHGGDFYPARNFPADSALVVSQQAISDFLEALKQTLGSESNTSHARSNSMQDPLLIFREMENLKFSEIVLAFVGEKDEHGANAATLLEVSARGQLRRVSLGEFRLADRRSGNINRQAGVLIGLANSETVKPTLGKITKIVSRIRDLLQERLGVAEDPFYKPNGRDGWQPKFGLRDDRGKADDRARKKADRTSVSLDSLIERGRQFAASGQDDAGDVEEDPTDVWLRENDPGS